MDAGIEVCFGSTQLVISLDLDVLGPQGLLAQLLSPNALDEGLGKLLRVQCNGMEVHHKGANGVRQNCSPDLAVAFGGQPDKAGAAQPEASSGAVCRERSSDGPRGQGSPNVEKSARSLWRTGSVGTVSRAHQDGSDAGADEGTAYTPSCGQSPGGRGRRASASRSRHSLRQTANADLEASQVVALYGFDPAELNWPFKSQAPLPLEKGQVIQVIHDDTEGGKWALGHVLGEPSQQGYFPKNYTISMATYRKMMPGQKVQELLASGARLPTPLNLQAWHEEDNDLESTLSSTFRSMASSVPCSAREEHEGGSAPSQAAALPSGRCPVNTPPTASAHSGALSFGQAAAAAAAYEKGFAPHGSDAPHATPSMSQAPSQPGGGACGAAPVAPCRAATVRAPSSGAIRGAHLPAFDGRPVATDNLDPDHPHRVHGAVAA